MGFFRKPFVYAGLFTLCLLAFTAYALLDVFVIPHPLSAVSPDASQRKRVRRPLLQRNRAKHPRGTLQPLR